MRVENLYKTFQKKIKAVQGVTFEVEEGDVFGFLGPNGAGKTTTIRMILGLIRPDSGEVYIDNYSIRKERFAALKKVGALVEGPAFYGYLSARDNLKIFAEYSGDISISRIDEVLEIVGLTKRAKDKVNGYSLGMRQRLGIAQALLNNPRLLILDEPTNGLDPYGVQEVRNLIKRLSCDEKITIFISSHILSEIEQICNKVAIINQGKLIVSGKVSELLNPEQRIYEITGPDLSNLKGLLKRMKNVVLISEEPLRFKINTVKPEDLLTSLVSSGAKVRAFYPYKPSLEEFFFNVTGGEKGEVCKDRAV